MKTPTRRHRSSDQPIGCHRTINPHEIDERYIGVLSRLDPYFHFKYATSPWLHYLSSIDVEYSVFRKYLGYLRQAPNRYIECPEQQNASPNAPYKTLVYSLAERGLSELTRRGALVKRPAEADATTPARRHRRFAVHRSNSYYHEVIVDLGYFAPLQHLIRSDPELRLLDFAQLASHPNVPEQTRVAKDPLLIELKSAQLRFDGTPHLLVRKRASAPSLSLGIPGIQVDRGTERFALVERHLLHALEFIEERHYERHWGFDNCVVPFLFTHASRKERAIQYIECQRGKSPHLLFKTIPDFGLLRHFPRPEHYERGYRYAEDEPVHPDSIHVFTTPWQRAGLADFFLNTFQAASADAISSAC